MAALKALLRFFSYLFHGLLALFLLAISGLALSSGVDMHLGMLPWTGDTLVRYVFTGSLIGLLIVILAMRGILRILFLLWSLVVVYFMVKGYWLSGYRFSGQEYQTALWLSVGSLLALPGAFQLRTKTKRSRRR